MTRLCVAKVAVMLVVVGSTCVSHRLAFCSTRTCPAIVAYTAENGGRYGLNIYSEGVSAMPFLPLSKVDRPVLLGYAGDSSTWVFCDESFTMPASLVLYNGKRMSRVALQSFPMSAAGYLTISAVCGENVVIPAVESGQLVIYGYSLSGKGLYRRVLRVPHSQFEYVVADHIAVAADGSVAASLIVAGTFHSPVPDSRLYVFDPRGKVLFAAKDGGRATISHDGKRVAYQPTPDTIAIADIKTHKRQAVSVWPQRSAKASERLGRFVAFRWDSRHDWLLCAYDHVIDTTYLPVFAVDLKSRGKQWKRLPIDVDAWRWVLLDEMPKPLSGPTGSTKR